MYSLTLKKPKVFYGYWIVAVAFFCAFINSGCGFYAFSLFVGPLQEEFGWGRGKIMLALSIFFLIGGMSAPVIGRLVDRYGSRKIIAAGASITGIGFISLSLAQNLWSFYTGYIVAGLGMAGAGMVPATALVSNWFNKWRGTAVGIMSGGIGAGGLVFAPLIGAYLIPNFGWRTAYLILALSTWVIIPLALLVIKTRPSDIGLNPDGRKNDEPVAEASFSADQGVTLKMALATLSLWLLAVSFLTHGFCEVGILQTQVPYLKDIGFPLAMASTAFGVVGFFSLVGKILFGWLCDRIKAKYACAIGLCVELAGLFILLAVSPASPMAILWLYAVVMGLGVGSWLPTMSMLVSTNFGLVAYGTIYGIISFTMSLGSATGPLTAGYIYDMKGSYHWAFVIFVILYFFAITTVLTVRRPKTLLDFSACEKAEILVPNQIQDQE
ncbi:MAG: MFS transporter [Deltaproteobacteria bacterium]|nr:MFS transporter [Deltaproteobacteria bacterium]